MSQNDETGDLQSMINSMSISQRTDPHQLDRLAAEMEKRLGISLPKHAYKQVASQIASLSLNKNGEQRTGDSLSDNERQNDNGDVQNTWSMTDSGSSLGSTPENISRNVSTRRGVARSPTPIGPFFEKSNTEDRQTETPGKTHQVRHRSRSPFRRTETPGKTHRVRQRSRSPFRFFGKKQPSEEKKELDETSSPEAPKRMGVTGVSSQRPHAPLAGQMASPIFSPQQRVGSSPSSPVGPTTASKQSDGYSPPEASPFLARPGLQEDVRINQSSSLSSPARPILTVKQHSSSRPSNRSTPRHRRSGSSCTDEGDGCYKPRVPSSFSSSRSLNGSPSFSSSRSLNGLRTMENEQSGNKTGPIDLDLPELQRCHSMEMKNTDNPTKAAAAAAPSGSSFFSPEPRPFVPNRPQGTEVKTADGKLRRKGATPEWISNKHALDSSFEQPSFAPAQTSSGDNGIHFEIGTGVNVGRPKGRRTSRRPSAGPIFVEKSQSTRAAAGADYAFLGSDRSKSDASSTVQSAVRVNTSDQPKADPAISPGEMFSPMQGVEINNTPKMGSPLPCGADVKFELGTSRSPPVQSPRFSRLARPRRGDQSRKSRLKNNFVFPEPLDATQQQSESQSVEGADHSFCQDAKSVASAVPNQTTTDHLYGGSSVPGVDYSGLTARVAALQEEAKCIYISGDYRSSILKYTEAIGLFGNRPEPARLISNRAAGLQMIGAYEVAATECERALPLVEDAPLKGEPLSTDNGSLLKVKLHTRRGRALVRQGDCEIAMIAFGQAIALIDSTVESIEKARAFPTNHVEQNKTVLSQMKSEAVMGQNEASRLRAEFENIEKRAVESRRSPADRKIYVELLGHVNMALSIAGGSLDLKMKKIELLVNLKRWREAAGFCERLAASNVRMDQIFTGDLAAKNPFPDALPAQTLTSDFFSKAREEADELKLNSKGVAEAVQFLPSALLPLYIRALRLEERYPAADAALHAIEGLNMRNAKSVISPWITEEREKLLQTKHARERGDELFRVGNFNEAAENYAMCLRIDAKGLTFNPAHSPSAGGRLHAVLHCNRAACLMALRKFSDAVEECSSALRIHSRYMKAMLRRARCYMRLQRFHEAISEYRRWLELVDEARTSPHSVPAFASPCLFDGPGDVSDADISQVNRELDEVFKAKNRAEAASREDANRRSESAKWKQDAFPQSSRSSWTKGTAQQRREDWYNQTDARRWDSFKNNDKKNGPSPRRSFHTRSRSQGPSSRYGDQRSSQNQGHNRNTSDSASLSPSSDTTRDHYKVLGLQQTCTGDEIKKSYRKLALKYHPDKNQEAGASDTFRRVKLAYETLSDASARRKYDEELRFSSRFRF